MDSTGSIKLHVLMRQETAVGLDKIQNLLDTGAEDVSPANTPPSYSGFRVSVDRTRVVRAFRPALSCIMRPGLAAEVPRFRTAKYARPDDICLYLRA